MIGEIPMGSEKYVDYPPDDNEYFYAVMVKSLEGQLYSYLLPFRNTLTRPAKVSSVFFAAEDEEPAAALASGTETEVFAPFISRLKTVL